MLSSQIQAIPTSKLLYKVLYWAFSPAGSVINMSRRPPSMDGALNSLASHHFALLYIDECGKLRFEASPSIANDAHSILSSEVTQLFLKAVTGSENGSRAGSESNLDLRTGRSSSSPDSPTSNSSPSSFISMPLDTSRKRKRGAHEYVMPMSITCHPRTMLSVSNESLLQKYYEKAFEALQQVNCRILAKAYIRLVEPRKQVNYPYNGHKVVAGVSQQFDPEETRPPWWPASAGVTHKEPDHLLKPERIRLLVYILCELRDSHGICVEKLREADQAIRRQIAPPERLQILDEIYRVRGEEERYLEGRSDAQTVVCVSRVHLPDMPDTQTSFYSPANSIPMSDTYRDDVPNLESHTSVFSSSLSTGDTLVRREYAATPTPITPVSMPAASTTWETYSSTIPVSATLPPINPSIRHPGTEHTSPYALEYPTPPTYGYHQPAPTLEMQPFSMGYANIPPHHLSQSVPHNGHQPYYFDY
ncbi:uncharacterized protein DSM5745_09536 [Aspergillus mulundensis]|uniref:Subtelomeric hrmA-associated cluster protein AFUB-079030/YDR124W-like helical bundle domain-containing protein n=1 Tax=Aspergillus mulundensis TaxID=1810919 RepID=A0A3D8QVJ0_9EURO|nr:Uncharacterized protein DSM5745_09536 [Aspergillus mulundensis]RDW65797.1 Uncharacterized protein DSM5745_09536 [Aspergillus mulundensis]